MRGQWRHGGAAYHVYLWSFKDSNGDGWGDLGGLIEKLDYLNDGTPGSLGIETIQLSPIFASPMVDFGYDVSDYRAVNPILGTLDDFDRLVREAHGRGMNVIIDFVPNHTSAQHPWFVGSRASKTAEKRDWYVWRDPSEDGGPPNNWRSVFGGPAWTFDPGTGQYYLHSFLPEQPDLDWTNPAVRAEMRDIMRFWLERGVDGFRIDAVLHLAKDPNFRDEPPNPYYRPGVDEPHQANLTVFSQGHAGILNIVRELCALAAPYDAFLIGETYLETDVMLALYDACKDRRFAPFNFNLMGLPWHAQDWREFIDDFDEHLPAGAMPTYVLGNHDRPRVATRLGPERARLATALLFTLRGMPFLYYADELGVPDAVVAADAVRDPFGKRMGVAAFDRDVSRAAMPWDGGPHRGFSDADPWLRAAFPEGMDVATERNDPGSMFAMVRRFIGLRNGSKALRGGSYRSVESAGHVFAFLREAEGDRVLVAANFSGAAAPAGLRGGLRLRRIEGTRAAPSAEVDAAAVTLEPYEAAVFAVLP